MCCTAAEWGLMDTIVMDDDFSMKAHFAQQIMSIEAESAASGSRNLENRLLDVNLPSMVSPPKRLRVAVKALEDKPQEVQNEDMEEK